jgi:hypothetical protein
VAIAADQRQHPPRRLPKGGYARNPSCCMDEPVAEIVPDFI